MTNQLKRMLEKCEEYSELALLLQIHERIATIRLLLHPNLQEMLAKNC